LSAMVIIQLDSLKEERLRELAAAQGEELSDLARRVVEDYLEAQSWTEDTPEAWADASLGLTPELLPEEAWDDRDAADGSR